MTLATIVKDDIIKFLTCNEELLFNERDLQMHLALWLKQSDQAYDDVDLEYFVPHKELGKDYIWGNELRIDIVVKKDGEYLPVELKYKTSSIKRKLLRFDEELSQPIDVMKNQGAYDLNLYKFWKDVRRIELVQKRFKQVKNGLAVFVTNDPSYLNSPKETSNNYLFRINEGIHENNKFWRDPDSYCAKNNQGFNLENTYEIHWSRTKTDGIDLHYCIVTI